MAKKKISTKKTVTKKEKTVTKPTKTVEKPKTVKKTFWSPTKGTFTVEVEI